MPNGLPALSPRGVRIEELFAPDIKDPIERVKRVENAVVELRHDFDAVLPAIMRLVAVEGDMQSLIKQLDTLVGAMPDAAATPAPSVDGGDPLAQPAPAQTLADNAPPPTPYAAAPEQAPAAAPLPPQTEAPVPTPAAMPQADGSEPLQPLQTLQAPQQETQQNLARPPPGGMPPQSAAEKPPPQQTGQSPPRPVPEPVQAGPPAVASPTPESPASAGAGVFVRGIRLGDHAGTVRIVLDTSGSAPHRSDLDNEETLLVVELPETGWTAKPADKLENPLIAAYSTQPMDGGGTRLVIQLKRATSIAGDSVLPPDGSSGYRIVLDLKK